MILPWNIIKVSVHRQKEEQIDIYRSEPFVYSQMTAGRDAATPGEGKNSWLTGTVAWSFVALSQHILGIRPDFSGLIVDPCIPTSWKEFDVSRVFRDNTFHFTIKNPKNVSKGVVSIHLNGKKIDGKLIQVTGINKKYSVEVIMG